MSRTFDKNIYMDPVIYDCVDHEHQETLFLDPEKELRVELTPTDGVTVCLDEGRAEMDFGAEMPIGYP
jgi:hypothetical protein